MRWDDFRRSDNVEDDRDSSSSGPSSLSVGGSGSRSISGPSIDDPPGTVDPVAVVVVVVVVVGRVVAADDPAEDGDEEDGGGLLEC